MMPLVLIGASNGEIFHKIFSRITESTIFVGLLVYISIACIFSSVSYYKDNKNLILVKKNAIDDMIIGESSDLDAINHSLEVGIKEGFNVYDNNYSADDEDNEENFLINDSEDLMSDSEDGSFNVARDGYEAIDKRSLENYNLQLEKSQPEQPTMTKKITNPLKLNRVKLEKLKDSLNPSEPSYTSATIPTLLMFFFLVVQNLLRGNSNLDSLADVKP
jgi:hypothetical protein